MRFRWLYLLMIVPTITDLLETGKLPSTPRESITEIFVAALLGAAAWLVCRQADQLAALATSDPLTGLGNRRKLEADLKRETGRARRIGAPLSVIYLDIDGFKAVNDRLGHAEGDRVLVGVADAVRRLVRADVDAGYRLGGDEFVVVLPSMSTVGAGEVAERLREAVAGSIHREFGAAVSLGVAELQEGDTPDQLLKRADLLMYQSKQGGKNRVSC